MSGAVGVGRILRRCTEGAGTDGSADTAARHHCLKADGSVLFEGSFPA
jgi:hypothetical protein